MKVGFVAVAVVFIVVYSAFIKENPAANRIQFYYRQTIYFKHICFRPYNDNSIDLCIKTALYLRIWKHGNAFTSNRHPSSVNSFFTTAPKRLSNIAIDNVVNIYNAR